MDDFGKATTAFGIMWIFGALLSLGFVGVIIWAIIRMVAKYG